jgi:4-oxalocrotonate tautomerase
MPIVRVEMWTGRSTEVKRKMAQEITTVVVKNTGCPPQAVTVLFADVAKDDWAIGGALAGECAPDSK